MEIQEFIQNFADQFDDTDANVFTPQTIFHDLEEYSSIVALSIIAMVDEGVWGDAERGRDECRCYDSRFV